jgi:hypothetical protein
MSTYIHQISQAEFAERNAKLNRTTEGMTVMVPNAFDRILAALRTALNKSAAKQVSANLRPAHTGLTK